MAKNNTHTFILSDESLNSYGFVVRTSGIDTERFKKNPIMLYNHNREGGIIGRWDNLRTDGVKLLADAVFDECSEVGKTVKQKVENGFLRAVSVGIEILEDRQIKTGSLKGFKEVVKCVLTEVSIVDIPSNPNTVKTLKNGLKCVFLRMDNDTDKKDLKERIIKILGLTSDVSDDAVIQALEKIIKEERKEDETKNALRLGYINPNELNYMRFMEQTDLQGFNAILQAKKEERERNVEELIKKSVYNGQILYYSRDIYKKIGLELGEKTLQTLLKSLPERITITDFIKGGKDADRSKWGLAEYRKYAPLELKNDPELYARLVADDNKNGTEKTLAWYRKNNPQYLQEHPDFYKHLIKTEY